MIAIMMKECVTEMLYLDVDMLASQRSFLLIASMHPYSAL